VILADSAKHSRDEGNAVLAEQIRRRSPRFGRFTKRVQRQLHAAQANAAQMLDKPHWAVRLKRPTADRQSLFQWCGHGTLGAEHVTSATEASRPSGAQQTR